MITLENFPPLMFAGLIFVMLIGFPVAFSLAALGFAVSAVVPSENAAPPIANVIVLPLEFISGIFVPSEQIPDWMDRIASVFPVKPLFDSLLEAFDPVATGIGVDWGALGVVALWGVVGGVFALRFFRWG